ncbi:hypothetical protein PC123_g22281 [Phytophthora cactorum]|nr:hypothetical protein PC123_g22281 [Phytophthora cactorum]
MLDGMSNVYALPCRSSTVNGSMKRGAWTNSITACRRWTKSIACVLNGLFSTAFFPAAGPASALSVPCTGP